jgi:hypothetical protein
MQKQGPKPRDVNEANERFWNAVRYRDDGTPATPPPSSTPSRLHRSINERFITPRKGARQ